MIHPNEALVVLQDYVVHKAYPDKAKALEEFNKVVEFGLSVIHGDVSEEAKNLVRKYFVSGFDLMWKVLEASKSPTTTKEQRDKLMEDLDKLADDAVLDRAAMEVNDSCEIH